MKRFGCRLRNIGFKINRRTAYESTGHVLVGMIACDFAISFGLYPGVLFPKPHTPVNLHC